ncbi:MAG: type II toxin-antitoxin system PemK/MazF family toxin [Victivallales bacterium]|jgi:mRNA interferase MazF|nr:type II toxin-antitoxin system PemK/MazF family toxin [Victivallales bacterium]
MRHGEVRWYAFRPPDKRRPVLVLTRDSVLEYLGEVTIAPVTTTVRDIPSEVLLGQGEGLPRDCAINCDHIQTVAKAKIGPLISTLPAGKMREVSRAVRFALDL